MKAFETPPASLEEREDQNLQLNLKVEVYNLRKICICKSQQSPKYSDNLEFHVTRVGGLQGWVELTLLNRIKITLRHTQGFCHLLLNQQE